MKTEDRNKLLVVVIVVAAILGLFALGSFTGKATYTTSTTTKNCRMVTETFDEQVPYTVQEPYQDTEYYQAPLQYNVESWTYPEEFLDGFNVKQKATVTLRNTDTQDGWYTVTYTFKTVDNQYPSAKQEYLTVGETKTLTFVVDLSWGKDTVGTYSVTPSDVTKSRIVTRYRDVTQYRTETRTVTKEVCE